MNNLNMNITLFKHDLGELQNKHHSKLPDFDT